MTDTASKPLRRPIPTQSINRPPHRELLVDNQPLLIMAGSEIRHDNLRRANMTEDDLFGKLREANAMNFEQVKAIVFETTGDVSVVHSANDLQFEPQIFSNVVDGERLLAREQGGGIRALSTN